MLSMTDRKKSLLFFFLLITPLVHAQNKNGLVSGPWAGNVQLRNATIWLEVSPQVKSVAVKYHVDSIQQPDVTIAYKGELGQDFNPVKIELNGLDINTRYSYQIVIDGKTIDPGFD